MPKQKNSNPYFTKYKMFIFSENVDKLIDFYTQALGLKIVGSLKLPQDYGYSVRIAPDYDLWIADHSKVKGKNKDTYRHMLSLYTDKVGKVFERIKNYPGVEIIQEPIPMNTFNPEEKSRYVATFTDPDGNCIQILGLLE